MKNPKFVTTWTPLGATAPETRHHRSRKGAARKARYVLRKWRVPVTIIPAAFWPLTVELHRMTVAPAATVESGGPDTAGDTRDPEGDS